MRGVHRVACFSGTRGPPRASCHPPVRPEDVRAEQPRLTHQPCRQLSWPPAWRAAGDGKRAPAWKEMKGGPQLRTPDATCPGCAGRSRDVLAPVGRSPSGGGGAGSPKAECRQCLAGSCQPLKSRDRLWPGIPELPSPHLAERLCNGERQTPPCLSLPSAKCLFSWMSPPGRRGGCLGHGAVGVGGGLSSQPPSRGVPCSLPPAEHQDAFLRTVMPQAPTLPGGAVSITAAVNPSSGEG